MTKQSKAKADQGYVPKAVPQVCGNCANFASDMIKPYLGNSFVKETNMRCVLGGFAVKKMGTCDLYGGDPEKNK